MTDTLLSVRVATLADQSAVDLLLSRSYPALLKGAYRPSVLVTAIPIISRAQPRLLASGTYYVVEDAAREIRGAGGWTFAAPGHGGRATGVGHVRHVVTDHRAVRRGIGRALIGHTVAEARVAGCRRLDSLSTLMAVPFYAAMGFREVGPQTIPLAPGIAFPAVAMTLTL